MRSVHNSAALGSLVVPVPSSDKGGRLGVGQAAPPLKIPTITETTSSSKQSSTSTEFLLKPGYDGAGGKA